MSLLLSLKLGEKSEIFRADFSKWLKSNTPPKLPARASFSDFVELSRDWQGKLASQAWVAVHWPERYGGRGLSIVEEAIAQELLAEAGAPQLVNILGLSMVGPVLIERADEEQKNSLLKKILTAEEIWCQGFSEPQAGSDLAAVRCEASQTADGGWAVSGQKIWTSFAQYADWCFSLVRTEKTEKKHKGLSYLLIPMKQEGVDVRPLMQISGDEEFNEIFFDKALVPKNRMLAEPGDGWSIAISTLMYERVVLTFVRHLQSEKVMQQIAKELRTQNPSENQLYEFGKLVSEHMAIRALALSHLTAYSFSQVAPGPEGSLDKLGWSEHFQKACKFALSLRGLEASLGLGEGSPELIHGYLYSRGRTIAAGTSEIQRNIISERLLGLERG